jgi:hypothetical protein
MEWLGNQLQGLFAWLVETLTGWVQAFFLGLRAFGDLELSAIMAAVSVGSPDVAALLGNSWLPKIDRLFPLAETLAFLTSYAVAWLAVSAYRLVKSWIPTVAT